MTQILSGSRSVRVVLYGSTTVESEHRFWIDPEVTFGGVAKALAEMYPSQESVVLQANWGPRPYWTESHPDSPIGSTCRVLYAILKDQAKPYTIGVVRTSLSDYPIPIYVPASKYSTTLLEAVIASYPKLTGQVKSIVLHPGDYDLQDGPWDNEFPRGQPYPAGPLFITTLDEPSKEFLAGSLYEAFSPLSPKASTSSDSDGLIPPLLQISFAECKLLVQRAYDLDAFPLQMIHLSEAIFHVVISLARSLTPIFESGSSSIGDALSAEDDLADHLRVAPLLCRKLEELLNAANSIMDNLESGSFDTEGARHAIEKIFATLCGDLPGAVTVRCSENDFKKFGSIDCQELDTLPIDTHNKSVEAAYPDFIMKDRRVANLDPMMDLDYRSDAGQLPDPSSELDSRFSSGKEGISEPTSTLWYPDSVEANPAAVSGVHSRPSTSNSEAHSPSAYPPPIPYPSPGLSHIPLSPGALSPGPHFKVEVVAVHARLGLDLDYSDNQGKNVDQTGTMNQNEVAPHRFRKYKAFVIRDIPPQATIPAEIHEVKKAISRAYHTTVMENDSRVRGPPLPNFEIELYEDDRGTGRLRSKGKMLVPVWGEAFKDYVQAHPVQVPFHPDYFNKSHVQWGQVAITEDYMALHQSKEKISNLQSTPWQDPDLERSHKLRLQALDGNCDVREIQFGFDHFRPPTRRGPGRHLQPTLAHRFFVEWARKFESTDTRACLKFEDGINSITILIGPENTLERQFLKVRYESVKTIQFKDHTIIFNLWTAPILEEGPINYDETRPRLRLCGLDDAHKRVISRFPTKFRVTLYGEDILNSFIKKASVVGLSVDPAHEYLDTDDGLGVMAVVNKKNKRRMGDYLDELSDTKMHELTRKWLSTVPYPVAFQLAALLQNGLVNPIEMRDLRPSIDNLICPSSLRSIEDVGRLLFSFSQLIPTWTFDNRFKCTLQQSFAKFEESFWKEGDNLTNTVKAGWFWSYRATLTPTTLRLSGPFQEQSNGVIRQYHYASECFLRLDFTDEERLQMRWDRDVQGDIFVKERVGGTLKSALNIAGRDFAFLGYSNSGLREHSVWFVTPFRNKENKIVTADTIRDGIANFSLRPGSESQLDQENNDANDPDFRGDPVAIARIRASEVKLRTLPSKLGARLAQAYTTTDPSIELSRDEIEIVSDIKVENPPSSTAATEFTDGYGCISLQLADEIWKALNADSSHLPSPAPSCYQIRMGGAKGVVGINPLLTGRKIVLHESMIKFLSSDTGIHIANKFDHPLALYLNRPLIAILEHLEVATNWFLRLQTLALSEANDTLLSISEDAAEFLNTRHLGRPYGFPAIIRGLKKYGISRASLEDAPHPMLDFFLRSLSVAIVHVDRELKYRARIRVPWGHSLVGVADVHKELEEGCVYICTQKSEQELQRYPETLPHVDSEGDAFAYVYITRSPSIHPGDVQRFRAMHPPKTSIYWKHPMVNCVVFSCKGSRPPASMLGGGDLDGDLFQIMPEMEDFKPEVSKPSGYPPERPLDLGRRVNIYDVADFVVDYINSDKMGLVAIQHLIISDQSRHGLHDKRCLKLAELHSRAVDFAKSGNPVHFDELPKRRNPYTPDFQHKETTLGDQTKYYESPKVLGVLYRSIQVRTPEHLSKGDNPTPKRVPFSRQPFYAKLVEICEAKQVTRGLMTDDRRLKIKKAFRSYATELRGIKSIYTIGHSPLSEEEVLMGTILAHATNRRSRDDMAVRLREVSSQLVDRVRMVFQGYRDDSKQESLHLWLVCSMYGLQCALAEEVDRIGDQIVTDWKEAQCSFGMIALRSAYECLDVMDNRRPDPRKHKPQ